MKIKFVPPRKLLFYEMLFEMLQKAYVNKDVETIKRATKYLLEKKGADTHEI